MVSAVLVEHRNPEIHEKHNSYTYIKNTIE